MTCGEEQHGELLTSLLDVMQDEAFADLKVRLGEGEVLVSRPLVAALSPVFRRMLTDPMREKNEGEIVLEYVSKEHWDILVAFYLTGERRVTAGNVVQIVELAHLLDMKSLVRLCSRILSESVALENWSTFLEIANKYELEDCVKSILRFMRENFEALSTMDQFCKLSKKNLEELLGDLVLVKTEDSVCMAVLSWMKHNRVDEDTAEQLFDLVSLEDVSLECIGTHVMYHSQILSFEGLKRSLVAEFQRRSSINKPSEITYIRPPKSLPNTLILGYDGQQMRVFGSSKGLDAFQELPSCHSGDRFATCMLGGCIYVTGGSTTRKSTFLFDLQTKAWSAGPDLVEGRQSHAMATIQRSLFAVAGYDGSKWLSSIEELPIQTNVWRTIGYLNLATTSCGVAAVHDTLLVVGGLDQNTLNTIQTFNLLTKTPSVLETRLPRPMKRAKGVQVPNGAFFVGQDGDLVRVRFSANGKPTVDHTQLTDFEQRGVFGLLVDSHVTVFGGGSDAAPGSAVERFTLDGKKDEWEAHPLPVPLRVSGVFRTKLSLE